MHSRVCVLIVAAAALLTGACGGDEEAGSADKFIADLSGDPFWKTVDRATAITACEVLSRAASVAVTPCERARSHAMRSLERATMRVVCPSTVG